MAILEAGTSKKFYTRENDETILKLIKEEKSVDEISKAVDHSPASIQYRIQRVLRNPKYNSLDDIKYKGTTAPTTETTETTETD